MTGKSASVPMAMSLPKCYESLRFSKFVVLFFTNWMSSKTHLFKKLIFLKVTEIDFKLALKLLYASSHLKIWTLMILVIKSQSQELFSRIRAKGNLVKNCLPKSMNQKILKKGKSKKFKILEKNLRIKK